MSSRETELEEVRPDLPEKRQDIIHYEVPRKLLNGSSIAYHGGVPPDQSTSPPFPTSSDPSQLIPAIADQGGAQPEQGTGSPPPSHSMAYQPNVAPSQYVQAPIVQTQPALQDLAVAPTVHKTQYMADATEFHVARTNLPMASAELPSPVQDTTEVAAAKQAHQLMLLL